MKVSPHTRPATRLQPRPMSARRHTIRRPRATAEALEERRLLADAFQLVAAGAPGRQFAALH